MQWRSVKSVSHLEHHIEELGERSARRDLACDEIVLSSSMSGSSSAGASGKNVDPASFSKMT